MLQTVGLEGQPGQPVVAATPGCSRASPIRGWPFGLRVPEGMKGRKPVMGVGPLSIAWEKKAIPRGKGGARRLSRSSRIGRRVPGCLPKPSKTGKRPFYEFAEVKLHGSVFSFGSCFSSPGRTFHVSIPPPGSPTRRLRQVGEPGGPRPSHPASLFCSHASSRPLQCLSSSRAGGFVRCATSSGRHDLLSVLIILHDQQHNTLYVFRRSKPGRGSVPI